MQKLKLKINASLAIFGTFSERYVPEGYFEQMDMEKILETISQIKDVSGMGVWYPGHPLIEEPQKLKKKFSDYGLKAACIGPDLYSDRKWKHGALSTHEKNIRKEAIKIVKRTIDIAVELDAYSVSVWPAHDGFDYVFESNYISSYGYLMESLEEVACYNPRVKIAIEYKQKDPRAKSYIEDVGKLLYILKSLKSENIGGAFDLGHSLFAQERPAESVALLGKLNKLYEVHLNDNYKDADPDLVFGSINFWETLEMFYWLAKFKFSGWLNIDTSSPRNDPEKMLKLAVKFIRDYERLANKLMELKEQIDNNLLNNNFVDNMLLIREKIFAE
ncbi:MAG: sugar phosphate isomerase/epimerase [Actinobacteria bacterium]|nr:sugar phosphate isomerase/epimerase [Actinomycetota bacterium]